MRIGVMEADIDSAVDAEIIARTGVKSIQLHTGGMCHLDAGMTEEGLRALGTDDVDLAILENIGNLVCPAEFDTGAVKNVMILSVPEGHDKPLKYPLIFTVCDVLIINKIDVMPYFDFDLEKVKEYAHMRNPDLKTTLYGVAMAVGGQVELEHHTMHRSMYFSNLSVGLPVYDILQTIFPNVPCIQVDCIGRMAGQSVLLNAELIHKNKRVFTLYIDRGITGCFFMDGKLQTESTLMLLEAGHMVLDAHDDERCTCGKYGCAESLISLQRMRRSIEEHLPQYPDSCLAHIAPRLIGFDDVFSGSRSGDALCMRESRRLAGAIGHLLRNIFLVCEPGLIVFMGNFSNADAVFDETLRAAVKSDFVYTLREGTFGVFYDRRDLPALEAQGCAQSVIKFFYDDERLYT